jgi:Uma2 family endonuclease
MVAALDSISVADIDLSEGGMLVLSDVSWERYEAIVAALETRHKYRTAYLDGVLEIMAPMPAHERPHRTIGYIVTALLDAEEREWEDFGATTFRKKEKKAGLEPDTCLYIGENALKVRACMAQMDLNAYPPPDLAIESDVTSSTTLEIYRINPELDFPKFLNLDVGASIARSGFEPRNKPNAAAVEKKSNQRQSINLAPPNVNHPKIPTSQLRRHDRVLQPLLRSLPL